MTSLVQKFEAEVELLWNDDIKPFFTGVSKEVVAFLGGAAKALEAAGGSEFIKLVTAVVVAESNTNGTGAQKLASAVATIQSQLGADAVNVALSTIHAGIEAAVANLPSVMPANDAALAAAAVNAVDPTAPVATVEANVQPITPVVPTTQPSAATSDAIEATVNAPTPTV